MDWIHLTRPTGNLMFDPREVSAVYCQQSEDNFEICLALRGGLKIILEKRATIKEANIMTTSYESIIKDALQKQQTKEQASIKTSEPLSEIQSSQSQFQEKASQFQEKSSQTLSLATTQKNKKPTNKSTNKRKTIQRKGRKN